MNGVLAWRALCSEPAWSLRVCTQTQSLSSYFTRFRRLGQQRGCYLIYSWLRPAKKGWRLVLLTIGVKGVWPGKAGAETAAVETLIKCPPKRRLARF